MPFLFKCQYTRRPGDTWLGGDASPALSSSFMPLIRPRYKLPPFPIGSTGQDLAGAVRDIGANPAAVLQRAAGPPIRQRARKSRLTSVKRAPCGGASAARPPRTGRFEAEGNALCRRLGRVKRKPARRGASAPAAGSRARPLSALTIVLHPTTAGPAFPPFA